MISVLFDDLNFDVDKWDKESKIRFTYYEDKTKMILHDWSIEGCPFNSVCDIIHDVMKQDELHNLVSFVVKAGAGDIEYERE